MVDAREYHERTSHTPRSVREGDGRLDPSTMPRPFKQYRDLPSEPLSSIRPTVQPALAAVAHSEADPLARAEQPSRERIDREALATICYESAGVVQHVTAHGGRELYFRAASCTGNLHHVDLYLVCGDLEDLDAGVYHFDPTSFSLDVLREGDYRAALATAAGADAGGAEGAAGFDDPVGTDDAATAVARAPVTVVATSTWARNAWKYGDRTYRHAFWDAGTVLANCLATAHALDYRAEVVAGFADDAVARLLGVEPEREAPIALVPLGADERPAPDAPPVERIDPAIVPPTENPADTGLIRDAWRQSALADGDAAAAFRHRCRERGRIGSSPPAHAAGTPGTRPAADAGAAAEAADGEIDAADDAIELDAVNPETASSRPLHHTIRRRGSCREYATEGPTRRQVATVLDRALRGVPADWTATSGDSETDASAASALAYNDAYVLATGVDGLPDGTYRLRSDRTPLDRLDDVDVATKTHLALDQDWAGDAHVNVYLLADLEAIVEALGDRGYRLAQLEAGIALGRLYLATYAHCDLGGTGLTFYDDLVAQWLAPADSGQTAASSQRDSDESSTTSLARTPTCLFAFGKRAD